MSAFLLYIARSGLYLGVFYAFYLLVMRRTTFFRLNRIALLAGSVLCALLPLLRVRATPLAATTVGQVSITGIGEATATESTAVAFNWPGLLSALYIIGIVAVIGYTVISALRLHKRVAGGTRMRIHGYKTVILSENLPSFTFGKTIYIGQKDLEENPAIFAHETMHVKYRHYVDLFLFRLVQTVWWWNPLVWIMRTELGLLHEYEADEGVIDQGINATQYQLLLVRKAVGEQRFSLASGFQHAQLKNRISMMLKPTTRGWMRLSYLALIPLMAVLVYACNPSKNSKVPKPADDAETVDPEATNSTYKVTVTDKPQADEASLPFSDVEVKPTFQGSDANAFAIWVHEHLQYPASAAEAGTQGRVVLSFVVDTDGSMKDIQILRGVSPELDAEALRVMNSCTEKWAPGMQDGKPVKVTYTMPIVFKLQ